MTPSSTLRTLLAGAIDYAGLFPPARLSMTDAVERYASYLQGENAWALGRFVLPAGRLDEFVSALRSLATGEAGWHLSATVGADAAADCSAVRAFNAEHASNACVDSIEMKVQGAISSARHEIAAVVRAFPGSMRVFAEIPLGMETSKFIEAARAEHASAKVRTGGVTVEAFPTATELATFLEGCSEERVSFKATAGLHHPCRGTFPLTYEVGAPMGAMFGFLNLLFAAALALTGVERAVLVSALESEQGSEFRFLDHEIAWRDVRVTAAQVLETRRTFMLSFGSCSFEEPMQDLRSLSLL